MPNIIDILARAQSLMNETALNSITPPRAGGIMYDTLLVLNQMQLEGASLLISKVYASVSAMEADTTPTSDLTGRALKPGQLVVIVTSDSSSSDMGSEYRFNGPGSWTYVGKVGGLPLDTVPTQNSTKGITSGGVYAAQAAIEEDLTQLKHEVSPLFLTTSDITPRLKELYLTGLDSTKKYYFKFLRYYNTGVQARVYSYTQDNFSDETEVARGDGSVINGVADFREVSSSGVSGYAVLNVKTTDTTNVQPKLNVAVCSSLDFSPEIFAYLRELIRASKTIPLGFGKNLYTGIEAGGFFSNDGALRTSASYSYTDYIPVKPSTAYYASRSGDGGFAGSSTYACFYNEGMKFISAIASNVKTFTTPANCYYMRFSVNNGYLDSELQIEEGSSRTSYEKGSILFKYLNAGIPNGVVSLDAISASAKDTEPVPVSVKLPVSGGIVTYLERNYVKFGCVNLFDGVLGAGLLKADGTIGSHSNYFYTEHYIPVKPQTTYCATADGDTYLGTSTIYILYYDRAKGIVSYEFMGTNKTFTTPDGCYYLRMTIYKTKTEKIQVEEGSSRTTYEPYNPVYKYLRPYEVAQSKSLVGSDRGVVTASSLAANTKLELTAFPAYCKVKTGATAVAFFSSFTDLYFGKEGRHGLCLKVDSTNVYFIVDLGLETEVVSNTIAHGLTIDTFLKVTIYQTAYSTFRIILFTKGGIKVIDTTTYYDFSNVWSVKSSGALTDVILTATCGAFRCPVWCFGDSYFGEYDNRVGGVLREFGFKNVYWANLLGGHGYHLQPDFATALNYGTPKYAVWGIGQNDADSSTEISSTWLTYTEKFLALCVEKGITPILCTIPNVSAEGNLRNHSFKNAWIKASGYRYIDTEAAVGAQADGSWYPGMLNTDEIHPTRLGAQAITTQWLIDFPEIMEYGMLNEELPTE